MMKILKYIFFTQILIQSLFYIFCIVYFLFIEKYPMEIFAETRIEYNHEYIFLNSIFNTVVLYTVSFIIILLCFYIINNKSISFKVICIVLFINTLSVFLFYSAGRFISINTISASVRNYFPFMGWPLTSKNPDSYYTNYKEIGLKIRTLEEEGQKKDTVYIYVLPDSIVLKVEKHSLYKDFYIMGEKKLSVFDPLNTLPIKKSN